jgi:hypothetical protein
MRSPKERAEFHTHLVKLRFLNQYRTLDMQPRASGKADRRTLPFLSAERIVGAKLCRLPKANTDRAKAAGPPS